MDAFTLLVGIAGISTFAYIIPLEVRYRTEKRDNTELRDKIGLLSDRIVRSDVEPLLIGGDGLTSSSSGLTGNLSDQRLKLLLVEAAAGKQSLNQVQRLASREGFTSPDVTKAVEVLSDRGLIAYSMPFTEDSIIELRV